MVLEQIFIRWTIILFCQPILSAIQNITALQGASHVTNLGLAHLIISPAVFLSVVGNYEMMSVLQTIYSRAIIDNQLSKTCVCLQTVS